MSIVPIFPRSVKRTDSGPTRKPTPPEGNVAQRLWRVVGYMRIALTHGAGAEGTRLVSRVVEQHAMDEEFGPRRLADPMQFPLAVEDDWEEDPGRVLDAQREFAVDMERLFRVGDEGVMEAGWARRDLRRAREKIGRGTDIDSVSVEPVSFKHVLLVDLISGAIGPELYILGGSDPS